MSNEFLGRGWHFPVTVDPATNHIQMSDDEQDIRESIWIILSTARGERVMRPDFGCGIHDYVFAILDQSTLSLVSHRVEEALGLWEPRIEVNQVTAKSDHAELGKLLVNIDYRVRSTNHQFNLVYPFYIREG